MMNRLGTVVLKDMVRLRVFLTEGINPNSVMLKKLLDFHTLEAILSKSEFNNFCEAQAGA
jgi:hypothetical protein